MSELAKILLSIMSGGHQGAMFMAVQQKRELFKHWYFPTFANVYLAAAGTLVRQ